MLKNRDDELLTHTSYHINKNKSVINGHQILTSFYPLSYIRPMNWATPDGWFPVPFTVGAKTWYGTSTLMAVVQCARLGVLPAVCYAHPAYYAFCVLLALL